MRVRHGSGEASPIDMPHPSQVVSIHPYFRVRAGHMDQAKVLLRRFVEATQPDPACLYYDFTIREDVVHCREAYVGADGLIGHLGQVGGVLEEFLKIAELVRLEIHGAASELEKLQGPFGHMSPEWFVFEVGTLRGAGTR